MEKVEKKSRISRFKEGLTGHIVDTSALLASTNPLYVAMEVGLAGMSDDVSIGSRITAAVLGYGGMGFVFVKGRDLSRKILHITDSTRERVQTLHDATYTAAFNLAMAPAIYLSMGSTIRQAIIGGLSAAAISPVMGPIMGYSVDIARDMTGLRNCERASYPDLIRKQRPSVKKGLAALLVAGSIAVTADIYALTPDKQSNSSYESAPIKTAEPQESK